ncbi:MAG: hypothetical protein ACK50A_04960 [Sphingobacteriaceae bacterium]|jgi:hypothetical protein
MQKRLILLISFLLTLNYFGQTYKGKGDSKSGEYKCFLKINPDSTLLFNYFDDRGNIVFADYRGNIKKINDSLFQVKCEMVFGQYCMKNFYPNNLTIVIDSGAQKLFTIKQLKVKYKNGLDTTFDAIFIEKSIFQNAYGTAVHDIFKNHDNPVIKLDIGYRDIIFNKKVLFTASSTTALNFVASSSETFLIKIKGDTIKTVGKPILQTGHLTMKKI